MSLKNHALMVNLALGQVSDSVELSEVELAVVNDMRVMWDKPKQNLQVYQVEYRENRVQRIFDWVVAYGSLYPCAESCMVAMAGYFRAAKYQEEMGAFIQDPQTKSVFNWIYTRLHQVNR